MEWGGLRGHTSPDLAQAVAIKGLKADEAASHVCERGPQHQSFHLPQTLTLSLPSPQWAAVFPED